MNNVYNLFAPFVPQAQINESKRARALLIQLAPQREGDVAAILDYNGSDEEAIRSWLLMNTPKMNRPHDLNECYERLASDLQNRISPF